MTDQSTEPPYTPRVGRLHTLGGVRREFARLYTDARTGKITPEAAGKLAYVLTSLHRTLEVGQIEARLDALEQRTRIKSRRKP